MEGAVVGGKGLLCSSLILLSFINAHYKYVQQNPRLFMVDNVVSGIAGALAAILMAFMRNRPDLMGSSAFIMFLFFFFFNVIKEFSGYHTFLEPKQASKAVKTEVKYLKYPIIVICGLFLAFMIYQALIQHDIPGVSFIPELLLTTGIFTVAEVLVAMNHKEDLKTSAISSVILYTIAGILFQFGGFYKYIYNKE